ncbi:helix-turn-helix domain-containing protein [Nocardia seriolae]|uniref:MerR family transcriptional regulator n=1 Tax=Nocardia seriolae TaxID=37332 RepID=A0A0B8N745_9NOCA|nr:helix-turn-helix domain-containing protein [Nocardia seriolae]MTJ62514.1 excisionase family DNA-binding protein [Nocardia seriolae]MTJ72837.1 excisionase family DNA-binding protein [Nocardia seriolae]MTJ87413.1 excisionase family DNA-binding protein [Nocardia seriolae]MTK31404.1 excisionase family DNA-binding protein [Nocardia seriolae]MTK40464.1 excisionase family DNA-binding protein [Nocardia seriolae]
MTDRLYSVDEVAERLGLHVRTVRGYVRDGKLPATRIGKQYRINRTDLAAFTGLPAPDSPRETAVRQRHSEVSSIVEVDAVEPPTADRVTTLLTGAAATRPADGTPLRVQTFYDRERARLKVMLVGGLGDTARLLEYMEGVLAS